MIIVKEFKFDCAHMLSDYAGKCANLHGHTYHGHVTIKDAVNPQTHMVLDYNIIKEVTDGFDHSILFSDSELRGEAEEQLYQWAIANDMKYCLMPVWAPKTTAECLCHWIAKMIKARCSETSIVSVNLSETDGSFAEETI